DEGVLLPRWGRWELETESLASMHLAGGTASLLRQRMAALDQPTRRVLVAGAVVGMLIEPAFLEEVSGSDGREVGVGVAEALRSQLIEPVGEGRFHFIHHTVREALLDSTSADELRTLHQRAAEALEARTRIGKHDPPSSRPSLEYDDPSDSDL